MKTFSLYLLVSLCLFRTWLLERRATHLQTALAGLTANGTLQAHLNSQQDDLNERFVAHMLDTNHAPQLRIVIPLHLLDPGGSATNSNPQSEIR